MKLYLALVLLLVDLALYAEAKPGRVRCSVNCWEEGVRCKNGCKSRNACEKRCQENVAECIRTVCKVSEHVDTYEEHQMHD
ncbi:unnamed protein product [Heterobilharzia americana]|nr:unnamed protein product [Heterobilharzia americana]